MKYFIISVILLFSFNGCQEKENESEIQARHDAQVAAKERAKVLAEFKAEKAKEAEVSAVKKSTEFLDNLKQKTESLVKSYVDINQTKKDLVSIQEKMQTQIQKISKDIDAKITETKTKLESNETKAFFQDLKAKMHTQMQKISYDIEASVEEGKKAGLEMAKSHIDLNKTKNLLEVWNKNIENLVTEFDKQMRTVESNTSKGN